MKIAPVNRNDIVGANYRFDPSFHLSEGVEIKRYLSRSPLGLTNISSIASRIFYGLRANRVYVSKKDHAIPFLTGASIMQSDLSNTKLVSKKYSPAIDEMTIKEGWVMITRSGTVGQTAWSNKIHSGKYGSEDIIRVVPINSVEGSIIYSYLASKFGNSLLTQGSFGAVIKHIEPDFVGNLPIPNFPIPFQSKVYSLIKQSATLREQATSTLDIAKNMLNDYCHFNYEEQYNQCKPLIVSRIISSYNTRIDASYFINNGIDWIRSTSQETIRLGDLDITSWYPGIFKRVYVDNGYPYIKGSALFETNPFRKCDHLSKSRTPMLEQLRLKEGMLLMSCAGLCGQVKMITKEYEDKEAIGSPDIIRLISNDSLITTEYLFVYFQLPAVYEFLQSLKYGSVIERFDINNIENTPIVKPSKELSSNITELVKQYMDCTYKAFCAEEKAITLIEQEIEKWQSPIALKSN